MYNGVTKLQDAEDIILSRAFLRSFTNLRKRERNNEVIRSIIPQETIKAVMNVAAPNTYLILERTCAAIQKAIEANSKAVTPDHVLEEEEALIPSQLEYEIMKELGKGRLSPSDLSEQLDKYSSSVVRTLKEMLKKRWVTRVGKGKRTYYSLTMRGDASVKRLERSRSG